MKILLINPPKYDKRLYTLRDEICFQNVKYVPFPLRLAQVASVLKHVSDVQVIDANALELGWAELEEQMPECDAVIFQSAAGLIAHDMKVADIVKRKFGRNIKTILIETVLAPIYPERILEDFMSLDIIVRGQPEVVIPDIVKNMKSNLQNVKGIAFRDVSGKIVATDSANIMDSLDELPFMAYDLFSMDRYSIGYLDLPFHEKRVHGIRIRTTRDCPYACPFCIIGSSRWRGYNRKWKAMSSERALNELEYVVDKYKIHGFFFWDETFTLDQSRAEKICDGIINRNLKLQWRCLTRIDCINQRLLEKMARAGCKLIEYGIESGDPSGRKDMQKNFSNQEAINIIKQTKEAGIKANCDLIVGMPWDDKNTLHRTFELAKELDADNIHLTMAFPYPKTQLFDIAEKENLIAASDMYPLIVGKRVRVGALAVMRTRRLSVDELEKIWKKMRRGINRYYIFKNVIKRPSIIRDILRKRGFSAILKGMQMLAKNT
ncbi:MAG: radical SAM protein [bacterium]|nr:radical SAM protein [bacterium]